MNQMAREVVWVTGHKNPDTDSICSAISYANLKNKTENMKFIPKRAGAISNETKYVLDRFGIEAPELVTDAGAQIKDIDFRRTQGVGGHISLRKAWEIMLNKDVVTLPVVDKSGILKGLISKGDIASSNMDVSDLTILGSARTQYMNIVETIGGKQITGNDHALFTTGKVIFLSGKNERREKEIDKGDLVIVDEIEDNQLIAVKKNAGCVIVCGKSGISDDVIDLAKGKDCVLISTPHDSFTVARLIPQSMPIQYFMTGGNLISFHEDDYIDEVLDTMSKIRHRDFPVVDKKYRLVGMLSRRNLINTNRKKFIMVDHNEKMQAIDNIDKAEILEIIDHHRLGALETMSPIFFRNQPVGCTSTIIYQMYFEKGVEIEPRYAGIMCAAILSDTLMFRSPTCTPADEMAARALAYIAGVNVEELATSMFEAGSSFEGKTVDEIIYQDFKIFDFDDFSFGVSQVSSVSRKQLDAIKGDLKAYLPTVLTEKGVKMAFVMLTDIFDEKTEAICGGDQGAEVLAAAFDKDENDEKFMLPGVVSRKKQFVPSIIQALDRVDIK